MSEIKFKGEIKNNRRIAGFNFTEILYSPNFYISRHLHQDACLSFVFQGGYKEVFREKTVEGKQSHLVFRPAGEVHSDYFGNQNTRCLLIEFDSRWLENHRNNSIPLNEPTSLRSDSLVWLARKLHKESQQIDDFTPLTVEGLMLEIVAEAGRQTVKYSGPQPPRWLKQAGEILHENFAEKMPLSEIAKAVGVHPVYLAEVFKRHYKCTVGEYVRRLRIEFASREISRTDAPLADIGLASGFSHQAHFSRTFKKLTGLTPVEFREISRR